MKSGSEPFTNTPRPSASEPLFVQALHYGWEDMEFARHRNGQQRFCAPLVARPEVCLNLDVRQLGLGGASCGPRPEAQYIFPIQEESWTMTLAPVCGKGTRDDLVRRARALDASAVVPAQKGKSEVTTEKAAQGEALL